MIDIALHAWLDEDYSSPGMYVDILQIKKDKMLMLLIQNERSHHEANIDIILAPLL